MVSPLRVVICVVFNEKQERQCSTESSKVQVAFCEVPTIQELLTELERGEHSRKRRKTSVVLSMRIKS